MGNDRLYEDILGQASAAAMNGIVISCKSPKHLMPLEKGMTGAAVAIGTASRRRSRGPIWMHGDGRADALYKGDALLCGRMARCMYAQIEG